MSTNTRSPQKRTDPRPAHSLVGIDQEGSHHIHATKTGTVHVITEDGDREHVQDLNGRTISSWMDYVTGKRGWTQRYLFDSAGDAFADALEVDS